GGAVDLDPERTVRRLHLRRPWAARPPRCRSRTGDLRVSYTLQVTGSRPTTINALVNMHRMTWAGHTKRTRAEWKQVAEHFGVPHLDSCSIVATPLHANRAAPQDVGACAPEVKAAIDGLR